MGRILRFDASQDVLGKSAGRGDRPEVQTVAQLDPRREFLKAIGDRCAEPGLDLGRDVEAPVDVATACRVRVAVEALKRPDVSALPGPLITPPPPDQTLKVTEQRTRLLVFDAKRSETDGHVGVHRTPGFRDETDSMKGVLRGLPPDVQGPRVCRHWYHLIPESVVGARPLPILYPGIP